ncbi:hypothetical protein MferCBS49748_005391 [Microsporum ferrugineum]
MALASAIGLGLYSLLMHTPTARPGRPGGGSGPPPVGPDLERMDDQGANRAQWSEADNELLLAMRRQKKPLEVIQQRFPNRTLAGGGQRRLPLRHNPSDMEQINKWCDASTQGPSLYFSTFLNQS